jgi:hypothetical protein
MSILFLGERRAGSYLGSPSGRRDSRQAETVARVLR